MLGPYISMSMVVRILKKWREILFKFLLARKRSFIQLLYRLKNISKYWEEFNTSNKSLARCPHCRKISSVSPGFARRRGIIYIIAALVYAIGATWESYRYIKREETEKRDYYYYIIFAAVLTALLCLVRGIYFCTIKISLTEEPLVLKNNNEEPP
ncbi:Type 1 phosphatidylinositol 4,5-bisphosphate 4-phosphatase [Formica fusca]